MTQPDVLNLLQDLIATAERAGADSADAVAMDGASVSHAWRLGKTERLERSEEGDIGLRVFIGQRQAIVDPQLLGPADPRAQLGADRPRTRVDDQQLEILHIPTHGAGQDWAGVCFVLHTTRHAYTSFDTGRSLSGLLGRIWGAAYDRLMSNALILMGCLSLLTGATLGLKNRNCAELIDVWVAKQGSVPFWLTIVVAKKMPDREDLAFLSNRGLITQCFSGWGWLWVQPRFVRTRGR